MPAGLNSKASANKQILSEHVQEPDAAECFTNTLREIVGKTIQITQNKQNKKRNPWFNNQCKDAINICRRAEMKFNQHPILENMNELHNSRSRARKIINTEKKCQKLNTSSTKI